MPFNVINVIGVINVLNVIQVMNIVNVAHVNTQFVYDNHLCKQSIFQKDCMYHSQCVKFNICLLQTCFLFQHDGERGDPIKI